MVDLAASPVRKRLVGGSRPVANLVPIESPVSGPASEDLLSNAAGAADQAQSRFTSKILLVSYYCPTRAHAGGLRILDIYAYLKEANPSLQVDLYTHHRPSIDWSIDECSKLFDNVYLAPGEELTVDGLAALGCPESYYDVIDLQFHHELQL